MDQPIFWIFLFIVSLAVLVQASDYFTDAAERIGKAMGIPVFIVGVTIVALGTSLPELVSSIIAVTSGASEIVAGNVVGSNIANIFLVLAVAAIVAKKMKVSFELINVDLPLLAGSALFLAATIYDGTFTFGEGILSILLLFVYLAYTVTTDEEVREKKKEGILKRADNFRKKLPVKDVLVLIGGAIFIYLGARYTIESVLRISEIYNIGTEIIAVTAVALGTSLPELVVSITAARKGKAEIAVGNVLGSNIFNALGVMGIPALFSTLVIPREIIVFAFPVMLIATLLYFFITQDRQITKWEGYLLLIFYIFFIGKIFSFI